MNLAAQVFAVVASVFHVGAFVMESLLFRDERVQTFLLGHREPSPGVRLWAFNQGFYNLFLAAGPVAGIIAHHNGSTDVGRALLIYGCAFMAGCGVVLWVSDRRLWQSMIAQSGPPLAALIALAI